MPCGEPRHRVVGIAEQRGGIEPGQAALGQHRRAARDAGRRRRSATPRRPTARCVRTSCRKASTSSALAGALADRAERQFAQASDSRSSGAPACKRARRGSACRRRCGRAAPAPRCRRARRPDRPHRPAARGACRQRSAAAAGRSRRVPIECSSRRTCAQQLLRIAVGGSVNGRPIRKRDARARAARTSRAPATRCRPA